MSTAGSLKDSVLVDLQGVTRSIPNSPSYAGSLTLTTNEQIRDFVNSYCSIDGDLTISGSLVTDLVPLYSLCGVIEGNLSVINTEAVSLRLICDYIGGNVLIDNNPNLIIIELPNTGVGGDFTVKNTADAIGSSLTLTGPTADAGGVGGDATIGPGNGPLNSDPQLPEPSQDPSPPGEQPKITIISQPITGTTAEISSDWDIIDVSGTSGPTIVTIFGNGTPDIRISTPTTTQVDIEPADFDINSSNYSLRVINAPNACYSTRTWRFVDQNLSLLNFPCLDSLEALYLISCYGSLSAFNSLETITTTLQVSAGLNISLANAFPSLTSAQSINISGSVTSLRNAFPVFNSPCNIFVGSTGHSVTGEFSALGAFPSWTGGATSDLYIRSWLEIMSGFESVTQLDELTLSFSDSRSFRALPILSSTEKLNVVWGDSSSYPNNFTFDNEYLSFSQKSETISVNYGDTVIIGGITSGATATVVGADSDPNDDDGYFVIEQRTGTFVPGEGLTWPVSFLVSSTASTGGLTSLTDSGQTWTTNQYAGKKVQIVSGTGSGQIRTISSNTAVTLEVSQSWDIVPNSTSLYRIVDYGVVKATAGVTNTETALSNLTTSNQVDIKVRRYNTGTFGANLSDALLSMSTVGAFSVTILDSSYSGSLIDPVWTNVFPSLTTINNTFYFRSDSLTSINTWFGSLQSLGGIRIIAYSIQSLTPINGLTYTGESYTIENAQAIQALPTIGAGSSIKDVFLQGLDNLTTAGFDDFCISLSSLPSIDKLTVQSISGFSLGNSQANTLVYNGVSSSDWSAGSRAWSGTGPYELRYLKHGRTTPLFTTDSLRGCRLYINNSVNSPITSNYMQNSVETFVLDVASFWSFGGTTNTYSIKRTFEPPYTGLCRIDGSKVLSSISGLAGQFIDKFLSDGFQGWQNAITSDIPVYLKFSSPSGTISANQIITGQTSGATAKYVDNSTALLPYQFLKLDPSGTNPERKFIVGETVTSSTGWSATVVSMTNTTSTIKVYDPPEIWP